MAPEDAARVRRAYEVWNESGPAAVIERFWAEDAVYREGPGWPDAGVYRGRAAVLARMQSLVDLVGPIAVGIDELSTWATAVSSLAFAWLGTAQPAICRTRSLLRSCTGSATGSSSRLTTTLTAPPPWKLQELRSRPISQERFGTV